jgi:hypothetical protein
MGLRNGDHQFADWQKWISFCEDDVEDGAALAAQIERCSLWISNALGTTRSTWC